MSIQNFKITYLDYNQSVAATTYSELRKGIKQRFKYLIDKFNIYYVDEENDKIIISNSDDFENLKESEKFHLNIEKEDDIEQLEILSQSSGELLETSLNESLLKLRQLTAIKKFSESFNEVFDNV